MTFRDDAEALRAKLDAAEAENARLRDELQHEHADALKQEREAKRAARRAWFSRTSDAIGRIARGLAWICGAIALLFLAFYGVMMLSMYADAQRAARRDAEVQRLEELRTHVPDGVDPELWSWCVSHCIRFGQEGTEGTYEGVITEIFIDHADGSSQTLRATIQGPWLTSSGATAITTSDITSSFQRGDMVVVRHTSHGTYIEQARPTPPVLFGPP